jgi:O-antigen/teichoic acid export membrane protein
MVGLRWSGISIVAFMGMQFGYQAVVSRLLSPTAFGLMAVATLATEFGLTFASMGLGQALVQKQDADEEDVRVVFTSSLLLGLGCFAALWVAAPLIVDLMNAPDALWLLRCTGLVMVFTTCGIASESVLRRQLRFRELARREIGAYVVGFLVVGIGAALAGAGVWSLVAARVSASFISTALAYSAARHSLRPLLGWRRVRPLYSFGGRSSLSGLLGYFSHNLDTAAVSRYAGSALLGQYSKAYMLTSYPTQLLVRSMARVLFPGFSQIQDDRERVRRAYVGSYSIASVLLLAICAAMAASSRELVYVLLGPQWDVAATILPILMLAAALRVLSHLTGVVFAALDELNKKILAECIAIAGLVAFLFVARGHGLWAYALALTGAEAVRLVLFTIMLRSVLGMQIHETVWPALRGLTSALVVGAFILAGREGMLALDAPAWLTLLVEGALAGVGLVVAIRLPVLRQTRMDTTHRLGQAGLLSGRNALTRMLRWLVASRPQEARSS